jgi:hypothetical protein
MKSITINDLYTLDNRYLLEIRTTSNCVFTCRKRFTCTTSPDTRTDHNEVIGIFGYVFPSETEDDIYKMGLELERSIPFNQIREVYIKL